MILNSKWTGDTSFNRLMSNIEIVPVFGTSFTVYIPILMIVISLITWFNGFSRIMRFIGIETDESSSLTIGKWKSGYSLTRSLTHSLTHSLNYLLTHLLTQLLTHSLTHSLTHTYLLTHSSRNTT
jgi:hypothetical protein